ncbi:hypothetical protein O71_17571 [Pontibacter sp. BAB1700]|nr:hypothetical protein O71_17571 [Pontibacter sp. BAB1700]
MSLAGLLLLALFVVFLFAEPLVERYLKKQVAEQTDGLYQLQLDELDLSLRNWGATLHGLHLYPDTAVHRQQKEKGQASPSLFEVQSPKLEITGINLRALIFNDRLAIGKVAAERPTITHLHDASVAKESAQDSRGGGGLEEVRIREIDLQEASYRYQLLGEQGRPQHDIPQLSLQVQELQLDLQAQGDISRMFQADGLDLDIRRYTYQAPDSVYTIRVGRFTYASGEQELKAQHIDVQPNLQANAALPQDQAHRTLYRFSSPLFAIQGLDVASAWEKKDLQLDQLLLERGSLQLHEIPNVPDTEESPSLEEQYAQLSPYLRALGIKELRLKDGSFSYHQGADTAQAIHRLAEANLHLEDLQLDSLTLFAPKEKAFAEALSISTGRYTFQPVQSPYTLQAGGLQLSTRDQLLEAKALHLAGDWSKNDRLKSQNLAKHTLYDVRLPQLRFEEMDLLESIRAVPANDRQHSGGAAGDRCAHRPACAEVRRRPRPAGVVPAGIKYGEQPGSRGDQHPRYRPHAAQQEQKHTAPAAAGACLLAGHGPGAGFRLCFRSGACDPPAGPGADGPELPLPDARQHIYLYPGRTPLLHPPAGVPGPVAGCKLE